MALNIMITGNVVNGGANAIDCSYQVFYPGYNVSTNVHTTQNQQYAFNLGDADGLTNDGSVNNGDVVLVAFWQDGLIGDAHSRFAVMRIVLDGSDLYVIDAQLRPSVNPVTNVMVSGQYVVGSTIYANAAGDDSFEWVYKGNVFRHIKTSDNTTIFPNVGISDIEYTFDTIKQSDNSFTFNTYGTYTIHSEVTNYYNQKSTSSTTIDVKKRIPVISITNSNVFAPKIYENTNVEYNVYDPDNSVTNVQSDMDGIENVDGNSSIYSWNALSHTHVFNVDIEYNDGFNSGLVSKDKIIYMTNTKPNISPEINNIDNSYVIIPNVNDAENLVKDVRYRVYTCSEAIFEENPNECNWTLLSDNTVTDGDYSTSMVFYKSGKFKITVIARDTWDYVSDVYETEFDVDILSDNIQEVYFDWE